MDWDFKSSFGKINKKTLSRERVYRFNAFL